jgi:regulator of protease activity HflC (stomatin/prohibitin superfamily)
MNRTMLSVVILLMLLVAVGCSSYSPAAGHQVVLVEHPLVFGHGGVDPTPVSTGQQYAAFSTEGIDIDMQPHVYNMEMDDIMTSDGVPITFHTSMSLQVIDSVALVTKFGPKWYENNVEPMFQTLVRQAVRSHGMNETAIQSAAIDDIDAQVRGDKPGITGMRQFLQAKGLPVQLVTLTVGKANPPDSVKNQRIATATQEQRIQTEQQMKLAEDQRKMAEESRAAADNAYRTSMGLSPEQYVQLQSIGMQREVCGHAACTFILSGTPAVYNLNK